MKKAIKAPNSLFLLAVILIITLVEVYESKSSLLPVISLTGIVSDKETGDAIDTRLNIYDKNEKLVFRTKTFKETGGKYFITGLNPGNDYKVVISSREYENLETSISLPKSERYLEVEKDFLLVPENY